MASIRQIVRIEQFGFSSEYAATLTNNQASRLIASLFHVADGLYGGDIDKLCADIKEFIQYKQEHKQ
ncbi:MAG: hypothetical protein ABSG23_06130 [Terriglobales bacterium]|jgi:hypothetical protein